MTSALPGPRVVATAGTGGQAGREACHRCHHGFDGRLAATRRELDGCPPPGCVAEPALTDGRAGRCRGWLGLAGPGEGQRAFEAPHP
jgi:hypothetical protein